MKSSYHFSKISGSQRSFLIETASWVRTREEKFGGTVPECSHSQKS